MTPKKPFKHQLASLKHGSKTPIVFDTSDAGTGKTAVRIWAYLSRRIGKMLVLCTRSNMRTVWEADVKKFAPHLITSVAFAENREVAFAKKADIYIVNHDGAKWLAKQKPAFFKDFTELVIDESSAYKHHTAQRSRAALKIAQHFKYRTCMTATPNSNTIVDVWHQALLLDGGKRLGKLFYPFRQTVAEPKQVGRSLHAVEWTDRDGAEEAVFGLLSDIVIRHELDSCADLPSIHQYPLSYELPAKQLKAYVELEAASLLRFQRDGSSPITAINAAAVATKLLQVASGAVYSSADRYHVVDHSRYDLVLDLVEERRHPLVLFLWKHQRDLLVAEAERRSLKFDVFDGDTSDKERLRIVQTYQAGLLDVLFAHPKSIGHGVTLTRGTSTIWASPTYDLELFVQASSRQRRIGQTHKTETVIVLAQDTLDERVYKLMLAKNSKMTNLLDLFSSITPAPKRKKVAA